MVYDTISRVRLVSPAEDRTGKRHAAFGGLCLLGTLISWFVGSLLYAANYGAIEQAHCVDLPTCPPQYQPVFATFAALYILGAVFIIVAIVFFIRFLLRGHKVRLHEYNCSLCGYEWDWREDQQNPNTGAVTANPLLIQKGQEMIQRNAAAAAAAEAYRRQQQRD